MPNTDSLLTHHSSINHLQHKNWTAVSISNKGVDKKPGHKRACRRRKFQFEENDLIEEVMVVMENNNNTVITNAPLHSEYIKQIPCYEKPPPLPWWAWFSGKKSCSQNENNDEFLNVVKELK